ncbi:MAG TPA: glycoside hydrolase family 15 protein [Acidimicrobiales bacterium]|nr:glycoside hydrolase family 15 protein [Acidimicrobiales bacterium]
MSKVASRPRVAQLDALSPHALRDYSFLADGFRGALLDPDGDVAWLCFPTWSDGAVFAGLLGGRGIYHLAPSGRRVPGGFYEAGTLIWHQRWVTDDGVVECCEALAYPGEADRCVLLRSIKAIDADAMIRVTLHLAPDYGRNGGGAWRRHEDGWLVDTGGFRARLSGPVLSSQPSDGRLDFHLRLPAGSTADLVLEMQRASQQATRPPDPADLWQRTRDAWGDAVPQCVGVPARRDVRHSIAVLRGMTDRNGATVAAATTSLPERAEAGRNYDYRYAWLRDICYIGHAGAAVPGGEVMLDDAVRWVTARLLEDGPDVRPAHLSGGRAVPDPEHLGLPGYPGGSDVVGNRASRQFQLDPFGEALLIFALADERDLLDADGWRAAEIALRAIEAKADRPEAGIWEIEPGRHWTHSRLICIAGLKAIAEQGAPLRWRTKALGLADHLLSRADATCLHPSGRWQRSPDDPRVDASLLLSEIRGALAPDDPRSVATRVALLDDLCDDDYLYRFAEPGLPLGQEEGAFLVCNFWMSLAYLGAGDVRNGAQWFEHTRASCSGSGLFSEEYDVAQRQLRGNLPQAFVHALLIETAGRLCNA